MTKDVVDEMLAKLCASLGNSVLRLGSKPATVRVHSL